MGYGAYMSITNKTSQACTINIYSENCMYDNGDEGSWLSYFNNLTLEPGATFPNTPHGVYIEAKASGSCLFEPSTFGMSVGNYGQIAFKESDNEYTSSQPPNLNVFIENPSSNATILIIIPAQ